MSVKAEVGLSCSFEADIENWVLDPFLVERILLPFSLRSATMYVWRNIMNYQSFVLKPIFCPLPSTSASHMCECTFRSISFCFALFTFCIPFSCGFNCPIIFWEQNIHIHEYKFMMICHSQSLLSQCTKAYEWGWGGGGGNWWWCSKMMLMSS